jgi:acyl-CoA synthetase (AMP-forming)/AMP-acid ligase II
MGAVPVPLKTGLRPGDYVYMLNDSRARALLIYAAVWQQIRQILSQLKYPRYVVVGLYASSEKLLSEPLPLAAWHQASEMSCRGDSADSVCKHLEELLYL